MLRISIYSSRNYGESTASTTFCVSSQVRREEDVTLSMYRNTAKDLPSERPAVGDKSTGQLSTPNAGGGNSPSSKVNGICDALLHELEKSAESRMQNIITAHVCKNPPDLDAGLTVVGEIRSM